MASRFAARPVGRRTCGQDEPAIRTRGILGLDRGLGEAGNGGF